MISVLLASRNGARTLPGVLDSLERAVAPTLGWQILVVDNGSTDDTTAVLESYLGRLPLIVLQEPRPGKNIGLNRALERVEGDLVIFTDDDVVLPTDFLVGYESLARREPGFDLFGGHVVPLWEREPERRLLDEIPLDIAFAVTGPDRARGPIRAGRLFGPNVTVRRTVFEAGLRFDENVGPNGGRYVMGSETEFLQRAEQAGHRAWFEPDIAVEHRVGAHQLDTRWLGERAARAGRTMLHQSLRKGAGPNGIATFFDCPRWALAEYARLRLKLLAGSLRSNSDGALAAHWRSSFLRGYAVEYRRLRRAGALDDQP